MAVSDYPIIGRWLDGGQVYHVRDTGEGRHLVDADGELVAIMVGWPPAEDPPAFYWYQQSLGSGYDGQPEFIHLQALMMIGGDAMGIPEDIRDLGEIHFDMELTTLRVKWGFGAKGVWLEATHLGEREELGYVNCEIDTPKLIPIGKWQAWARIAPAGLLDRLAVEAKRRYVHKALPSLYARQ
jgi:hypothetical protein